MKQKVEIKVSLHCRKCNSVALKTAAGVSDVDSIALKGDDTIEVTGDGLDAVEIVTSLRKKLKCAELVSVGSAEGEKKQEDKGNKKDPKKPLDCSTCHGGLPRYVYIVDSIDTFCHSWNCAIM